VQMSLNTKLCK